MAWYDVFASFYDNTVERVYRPYRSEAVAALNLRQGQSVLDLACGTGPNLEHLVPAVGPRGDVFAVDYSEGMLARAARRVERAGWSRVTVSSETPGSSPAVICRPRRAKTHNSTRYSRRSASRSYPTGRTCSEPPGNFCQWADAT